MLMEDVLKQGVNGGNLLFCGAGFSADCISFSEERLGTLQPLLEELNDELGYDYKNIRHATDAYSKARGQNGLLKLLQDKYSVSERAMNVDAILNYPWDRIYTTNYDDVIAQSLTHLKVKHRVINNVNLPKDLEEINDENTRWVVHLHGAMRYWNNLAEFEKSCVLGRKSYMEIGVNSKWLPRFKHDYAKAKGVFFVGFSNSDFYFDQEIYSVQASRNKVFFINSKDSDKNLDMKATQEDYGQSHSIGKEHFAEMVSSALKNTKQLPPNFRNFEHCKLENLTSQRAGVEQQKSFFISGRQDDGLLYHDILEGSHSYRAKRESTDKVVEFFQQDNSVALIIGGLCSGKTTVLDECVIRFLIDGYNVFKFKKGFDNLLPEVRSIIKKHPDSTIVIDDCFTLKDSFKEIIKMFNESGHKLLLSTRSLAYDFQEDLRNIINEETPFKIFDIEILDREERGELIDCADRMGIWGEDVQSPEQKQRILEKDNHSRLSSFLLHIFKSEVVRDMFTYELNKIKAGSEDAEKALIIALYLRSINGTVEERVLSDLIQKDAVHLFKKFTPNPFISYNSLKGEFDVIPGINAREALKSFFNLETVTITIVQAVAALEDVRNEYPFNNIFAQMMRYTQLKQIVSDYEQQNFFFDRLSELKFCRDHRFFWLQWSMAMRDQKQWQKAFQYLSEAYGRAKQQNSGTLPLDDQKAGLLLDSISEDCSSGEAVRIFREVSTLLNSSINISTGKETSHNYHTIKSFDNFFPKIENILSEEHKPLFNTSLKHLKKIIESKIPNQYDNSYIKKAMQRAVVSIDKALSIVQPKEQ